MKKIIIHTKGREVLDITKKVEDVLNTQKIKYGLLNLFIEHTTAALTVADMDPGTDKDLMEAFENMVPKLKYRHPHDPTHVGDHIMSALMGVSLNLPIIKGKLVLGSWQRIVLVDFNGPRSRTINMTFLPEK